MMKAVVSTLVVLFTCLGLQAQTRTGGGTTPTITDASWTGGLYSGPSGNYTQLACSVSIVGAPNTTYRVIACYLPDCAVQPAWYVLGDAQIATDATGAGFKYFVGTNPAANGQQGVIVPEFGWQVQALLYAVPGSLDTPLSEVDSWVTYTDYR